MPQKYGKCPFPNCERRIIPSRSPHGFCLEHEKFANDLLFILPFLKPMPGRKGGLILPGEKDFVMPKIDAAKVKRE